MKTLKDSLDHLARRQVSRESERRAGKVITAFVEGRVDEDCLRANLRQEYQRMLEMDPGVR